MSEIRETSRAAPGMMTPMQMDQDACYRALLARDARFDGRIFVGVKTTGVYCRPVCPARTPKRQNVLFFPNASAAQAAGYRPCLRCRPEVSPELASWRGTSNTVSRALALIEAGALDAGGVESLAERLGVGARQLRRLFAEQLGACPNAVAQTRRVLLAKQLIHDTRLPMVQVALASGFGSVRRFNESFQRLYGRAPASLRHGARPSASERAGVVSLRLAHALPYDWDAMLSFLAERAIPGVELVSGARYVRTIALGSERGLLSVEPSGRGQLGVQLRFPSLSALPGILARVRRVFDLAADPGAIGAHLSQDPRLAPLIAARPGLRVPGAWDGFELAVRAILGQQITVRAATQLAGKLAARYGEPISAELARAAPGLSHLFPSPDRLAALTGEGLAPNAERAAGERRPASDRPARHPAERTARERAASAEAARVARAAEQSAQTSPGMPKARAAALSALARALAADPALLRPRGSLDEAVTALKALPGIGAWTAQYIALRALREPDAFPAADLGLRRALAAPDGSLPSASELAMCAERWRPWRAYAALHLWASLPSPAISRRPRAA